VFDHHQRGRLSKVRFLWCHLQTLRYSSLVPKCFCSGPITRQGMDTGCLSRVPRRERSQKARRDHVGRTKSSDRQRQNRLSLTATSTTSIPHRTKTNTDGNNKQGSALSAVKRNHPSLVDRPQGPGRIHTRPFSPLSA